MHIITNQHKTNKLICLSKIWNILYAFDIIFITSLYIFSYCHL